MKDDLQEIIQDWHSRIEPNQEAYYLAAERYNKLHYSIGLPAIILSTLAGATLLTDIASPHAKTIVGVIGLLAALLSSVQTFYSFAQRSEKCRAVSSQLGDIRRDIEILEKYPPPNKKTQAEMIRQISDRIAVIDHDAPPLGNSTPKSSEPQPGKPAETVHLVPRPLLSRPRPLVMLAKTRTRMKK